MSVPEVKERARRKWKAEGREKTGTARERQRKKRASSVPRRQMRKGHDSRREEKEVAAC